MTIAASAEWTGLGAPLRGEGVGDWVQAVEDAAARMAERVRDAWLSGGEGARRATAHAMADALGRIDEWDRARRVADCHAAGQIEIDAGGRARSRPQYRCRQIRACPWCARAEAARRARRLADAIRLTVGRKQFVTLTMRNAPKGALAAHEAAFWRAWDRLRARVAWKSAVVAASASMETTWNAPAQTYHVHLHVAVALRPRADFSWAAVQEAWAEISGSPGVDFRPLKGAGGVIEATKYAAKLKAEGGTGLADMPADAFREWWSVFGRPHHRLWRTYGQWRAVAGRADMESEDAPQAVEDSPSEREPAARLGWDPASVVFLIQPDISIDALVVAEQAVDRYCARIAEKRARRAAKGGEKRGEKDRDSGGGRGSACA